MKVFMIGGTGLLGCEAARIFIERGHQVKSVALPPLPEGAPIPRKWNLNSATSTKSQMKKSRLSWQVATASFSQQVSTKELNSPHPFMMHTTSITLLLLREFFLFVKRSA